MKLKFAQFALTGFAMLGLLAHSGAPPARADAVNYSGEQRQINACVLVSAATSNFNAGGGPNNPVPYLFYAIDSRKDYKLGGWTFTNPLAPANITQDMYNRWKARQANNGTDPAFVNGTAQAQLFQVGAALNKNIGAYWEVNLDTVSDADLDQFNVVFLPLQGGRNAGSISFDSNEREKLRHYLDAGGTIWVENEGANNFQGFSNANALVDFVVNIPLGAAPAANAMSIASLYHPLVNYPFTFSPTEVAQLGAAVGLGNRLPFIDTVDPTLVPVLQISGTPMVSAGDFGAGHIIVSAAGIAADINDFLGGTNGVAGGLNDGAVSGNNVAAIPQTDLKFGINVIAWLSSIPAPGANQRRTGTTQEIIGHNIAPKFSTIPGFGTTNPYPAANAGSGAVISKNVAFWVDGNNFLHAYNITPGQNLSGQAFTPENGLQDILLGYPYDEIWNASLGNTGTRYSTPSVFSVFTQNFNGYTGDYGVVVVTNDVGQTAAYTAFPRNAGVLQSASTQLFTFGAAGTKNAAINSANPILPVPAAAYAEGVLFTPFNTGSGTWSVAALDLLQSVATGGAVNAFGSNAGVMPTTGTFNPSPPPPNDLKQLSDLCGSLTVGYVKDSQTGAIDEVVYAPTQYNANFGSNGVQGQVQGLWFRTRNEPLQPTDQISPHQRYQPHGDRSWIPWFVPTANPAGSIDMRPVLHVIGKDTTTGQATYVEDYVYDTGGAGAFTIQFSTNAVPDNPTLLPQGQPQQHYMEVDVQSGIVPADTSTTTYSASVDYFIDWPGASIGGTQLNGFDMALITNHRTFGLYPDNNPQTGEHQMGAGVGMGSDDSLNFASSPVGLTDQLAQGTPILPDRLYSLLDQYASQIQTPGRNTALGGQVNWMWAPTFTENFNTGAIDVPIKARLTDTDTSVPALTGDAVDGTAALFHIVGQPVASNGVVYAVANAVMRSGTVVTVVLALKQQIDATIHLNPPIQIQSVNNIQRNRIQVEQPDLSRSSLSNGTVSPAFIRLFEGADFTTDVVSDATGDYITSIHINNMRPGRGTDSFNVALPIIVIDTGGNPTVYTNTATGYGPLDNVLWYLILPQNASAFANTLPPELQSVGAATSGPSVFGQTLYYGTANGSLVAVDLQGASQDSRLVASNGTPHVHALPTLLGANGAPLAGNILISPPTATEDTVVVGSANGLAALDNRATLIADSNRLLEVDASASALWSLDATTEQQIVGGPLTANGAVANASVSFARPTVARRTAPNNYMVADANNNRIVQVDRGGKVLDAIHTVNNDLGFLQPGDPVTLNHPTDVEIYTELNNTLQLTDPITGVSFSYNAPYIATHYLIADSGNYRVIEALDVTDATTGQPAQLKGSDGSTVNMIHEVIFSTRTLSEQNQHFRYRTIQQFVDQNNNILMIAAVDNVRQPTVEGASVQSFGSAGSIQEAPGGSVVIMSRNYSGNGTDGTIQAVIDSISIPTANLSQVVRRQPINGPTWFKEFNYIDPANTAAGRQLHYLLADANGCYELAAYYVDPTGKIIIPTPAGQQPNELVVTWMLSDSDYFNLTGRRLRASSIERLTQAELYTDANGVTRFAPHYLITNSYTGADNVVEKFGQYPNVTDGKVTGEVFEIRSKDYYDQPNTQTPNIAADGTYVGYNVAGNQLYIAAAGPAPFQNLTLLQLNVPTIGNPGTPGSSIVRMIPAETLIQVDNNGNLLQRPIKRSIGSYSDSTTTYTLQQPQFSDRPY